MEEWPLLWQQPPIEDLIGVQGVGHRPLLTDPTVTAPEGAPLGAVSGKHPGAGELCPAVEASN
eukprot:11448578-Heterocapsa_arctica.AAC.1